MRTLLASALAYPPAQAYRYATHLSVMCHAASGVPVRRTAASCRPCASCINGAVGPPSRCCCRQCPGSTQRQARQAAFGVGGNDGRDRGGSAVMSGLVGGTGAPPPLAGSCQHAVVLLAAALLLPGLGQAVNTNPASDLLSPPDKYPVP